MSSDPSHHPPVTQCDGLRLRVPAGECLSVSCRKLVQAEFVLEPVAENYDKGKLERGIPSHCNRKHHHTQHAHNHWGCLLTQVATPMGSCSAFALASFSVCAQAECATCPAAAVVQLKLQQDHSPRDWVSRERPPFGSAGAGVGVGSPGT